MWSNAPLASPSTFSDAELEAAGATLAGHTDWRLPTRSEFAGLIETACADPAINTTRFTPGAKRSFWTAEPGGGNTAWSFDLTFGNDTLETRSTRKGVYLVRSVQIGLFANGFE
ncbi:MAG: DUF1566 domain-containing protein [Ahniella sp.]|nr:DUF1566 domain-containing protein [Ahniella sp.]